MYKKRSQAIALSLGILALITVGTTVSMLSSMTTALISRAAGQAVLIFEPAVYSGAVGDTFNSQIRLEPNGEEIAALQATIIYDPTILQVESVTPGDFFKTSAGDPLVLHQVVSQGKIEFAYSFQLQQPPVTSSEIGNIVDITFSSIGIGNTGVKIATGEDQTIVVDINGERVLSEVINLYADIAQAPSNTPDPTPVAPSFPSPTPFASPIPSTSPTSIPSLLSRVEGYVVNQDTNTIVPFTEVTLIDPTVKGKKGELLTLETDALGYFDFAYEAGNYVMVASSRDYDGTDVEVVIPTDGEVFVELFVTSKGNTGGGNTGNNGKGNGNKKN